MRKQTEKQKHDYNKYKHHISELRDLEQKLEEMGIPVPNDDDVMWVYLQSFKDDNILTDKYSKLLEEAKQHDDPELYIERKYYGIMDEEMKRHIGEVIDYDIYLQTIVEMKFSEFKQLYQTQTAERKLLSIQNPGLIIEYKSDYLKSKKEELREYQKEYYERVTKKKREEKRKLESDIL
jgi:hypothetical protein